MKITLFDDFKIKSFFKLKIKAFIVYLCLFLLNFRGLNGNYSKEKTENKTFLLSNTNNLIHSEMSSSSNSNSA